MSENASRSPCWWQPPVVEFHSQKGETVKSCSVHSIQMVRRLCFTCGRWKVLENSGEVQAPCAVLGSMVVYDPQSLSSKFSFTQTISVYCLFCRQGHRAPRTACCIVYFTIFVSCALRYKKQQRRMCLQRLHCKGGGFYCLTGDVRTGRVHGPGT